MDLLLSQVSGIIEKHTDATVLEACGTLVSTLCDDRYTFSPRTNRAFSQLMDGLTEHFNAYLSDLLQVKSGQMFYEKHAHTILSRVSMRDR